MSSPIRVKRGIHIDMGCSHICPVDDGVFIPTGYGSAESNKKFQEELDAFLEKWFTPCEGGGCEVERESEEIRNKISKSAARFSLSAASGNVEDLARFAPEWSEFSRKLLFFWVNQGSPRLPS